MTDPTQLSWEHEKDTPGEWRAATIKPGWLARAQNDFRHWWVTIIGDTRHGPMPFAESVLLASLSEAKDWTRRYLAGDDPPMERRPCRLALSWREAQDMAEAMDTPDA